VVATAIRKTAWWAGILGFLVTVFLSSWLSFFTFQNSDHTIAIALLGLTVLLTNISIGQVCLLQGTRRIMDVAKISVISAFNSMIFSIPCFYFWEADGIVPSMVLTSFLTLATSWWFARRVKIFDAQITRPSLLLETKRLLNFGLPVMGTAIQGSLVAYLLRLIIAEHFGLVGVGVWSAAFSISGILVNFVLNAMGTDYYPRLTSVIHDKSLVQKEVNTQLEIALLLAAPALMVTILFAPIGIELLYSGKFDESIPILRWSVYGIFGRVISWPLSYIVLAQGRGRLFFLGELLFHVFHLLLIYICSKFWGLPGTGICYAILYIYYFLFMTITAYSISKTYFSLSNLKLLVFVLFLLIVASCLPVIISNCFVYYFVSIIFSSTVLLLSFHRLSAKTGITFKSFRNRLFGGANN